MVFNVAKIASARASSTISLTKSLRVAGPLVCYYTLPVITKHDGLMLLDRNCDVEQSAYIY